MRLANVIRAQQKQPLLGDGTLDIRLDQMEAMAAAGDTDAERYLRLLMDGQEPTEQFFGGAQPS
jgi:hypothetical protein